MLFNSLSFLVFFPVVTIIYFLLPFKYRWLWLLAASCYFYMFFKPVYILILFFTIVIDYLAGIAIENGGTQKVKRRFLILSLIANIGVLAIFKYFNFLNFNLSVVFEAAGAKNPIPFLNILLPIGLSFHTFQAMSYTIEVYLGNQKAERHFGYYSLYVMFYPQLVAGPIERPQNIIPQLHQEHYFNYAFAVQGLRLMLLGFVKKIVIADNLATLVNSVYSDLANQNSITLMMAALFFSVQIYCDFSGYSDIALGSAKVMGIDLMQNFRQPYCSSSIKEFWSRWHISLSSWFRDYLYIPLGGNRVSKARLYFNTMVVFIVSGLWHGANFTFIVWGFIHGVFVNISNAIDKKRKLLHPSALYKSFSTLAVFLLVTGAWVFFRAPDLTTAIRFLSELISGACKTTRELLAGEPVFAPLKLDNSWQLLFLCLLFLFSFFIDFLTSSKRIGKVFMHDAKFRYAVYASSIILILFCGFMEEMQFIYFQF